MGEPPAIPGTQQSSEEGDLRIVPGGLRETEEGVSGGVEGGEGERGHVPSPHLGRRGGEGQGVGGQHQGHVREDVNIIPPPPLSVATTHCLFSPYHSLHTTQRLHQTYSTKAPFHSSLISILITNALPLFNYSLPRHAR